MARPTNTQKRQRAQVNLQTSTPNLDVVAPMDVQTAPASQGWAQLQNALGVGAKIYAQHKEKKGNESEKQGYADQTLDRADMERMQREQKYADGVTKASVVTQVSAAIAAAEENAAQTLDEDAPVSEQLDRIDQFLKAELGPLANDPEHRLIIADHYQNYLEKFAARATAQSRDRHKATIEQATSIELNRALEGDNVDIAAWVNSASPAFPGGRTALWQFTVEHVAQKIEETNDPSLRLLLPDRVLTEDGQTIDSPVRSSVNRARINLAVARAEKYLQEKAEPMQEWRDAQVLDYFNQRIDNGEPVELPEVEFMVTEGRWSGEYAAGIVQRSRDEMARRAKEAGEFDGAVALMNGLGVKSFLDIRTYPGGPETKEQAQKLTDSMFQRIAVGYAGRQRLDVIPLTGAQLREHPALLNEVFKRTIDTRLPMTLVKSYFDEVDPTMGATVIDRLGMYRLAKAHGVVSKYVNEETEAVFELAMSAAAAYGVDVDDPKLSPEKRKTLEDSLLKLSDPAIRAYVRENREKAHKAVTTGKMDVIEQFRDVRIADVANLPLVQAKLRSLTDVYLSAGHKYPKAAELAQQRYAETHYGVALSGKTYLLPVGDVDPAEATVAAQSFDKNAAELARSKGDPNPEAATLVARAGLNGRGLEYVFVGSDGLELPGLKPMTIEKMIAIRRDKKPDAFAAAVRANREAQNARAAKMRRLKEQAFRPLPTGPKY